MSEEKAPSEPTRPAEKKAPLPASKEAVPEAPPLPRLRPVKKRIGETCGNLEARAKAFAKRHGDSSS